MNIIPSLPTLWVEKDNFVTKILKDQWPKWGASSVCFLIRKIPSKEFTVTLVDDSKKKINTDDFKVSFEKEETNELGHKNVKLYTYNGTETIPNLESELLLRVQINFCSSKYEHAVMHVEVSCNGRKACTPPFYVASRARNFKDKQPKRMSISLDEIKTLRKPRSISRNKSLWGGKRKRQAIVEDSDTDTDTDTDRETYENTKQIKETLRKEFSNMKKFLADMKTTMVQQKELIDQLLEQQQEFFNRDEADDEEGEGEEEDEGEENAEKEGEGNLLDGLLEFNSDDDDAKHVYESFRNNSSFRNNNSMDGLFLLDHH